MKTTKRSSGTLGQYMYFFRYSPSQRLFLSCRATISPALSPTVRAAPLTPVKPPLLSPKNLSPKSPTRYHPIKQASISANLTPVAPQGPPAATTAQDLLNDVMGLGSPHRNLTGNLGQPSNSISTAPQSQFLFGSELSHRPSQSIWSASVDEQPLMYTGTSNNTSTQHSGGHIYQTSPRQFAVAPGSQELSQQSNIWTSSYQSQSQNSQQSLGGALPSAQFALPPMLPTSGRQAHQRVPSSSVPVQNFGNHHQAHLDPFAYTPPVQAPIPRPQHMLSPSSGFLNSTLSQGGFGGGSSADYYASPNPGFHSRQMPMHDPRIPQHNYMSPPMSQIWGHTG